MTVYLLSILIALVGSTLHWAKRYARDQTSRNLFQHLSDFKTYTLMSFGSVLAAVGGILTIIPDTAFDNPVFISQLILSGWTIDSALNKDMDS
jgi:hypothetical protein